MSVILRKKNRVTKLQTFHRNNPKLYVSVNGTRPIIVSKTNETKSAEKSAFRGLDFVAGDQCNSILPLFLLSRED